MGVRPALDAALRFDAGTAPTMGGALAMGGAPATGAGTWFGMSQRSAVAGGKGAGAWGSGEVLRGLRTTALPPGPGTG